MAGGDTEPAFWGGYQVGWGLSREEGRAGRFLLFSGFQICKKHPNPGVTMKKEYFRVGCPPLAGPGEGFWSPRHCLGSYRLTCAARARGGGVTSRNCSEGSRVVLVSLRGLGNDHLVPGAGLSWRRARALPSSSKQSQLDSRSQTPQRSPPQKGHRRESSPDLPFAEVVVLEGSAPSSQ